MCEANKNLVRDCLKDSKYYKSLLNLISSEENNEQISENLQVVVSYLEHIVNVLEAVISIAEE